MKPGFSMPQTAPLYEPPPYMYQGNCSINILFRTTPETLHGLVPEPLVPNPDGLIFLYVAQFHVIAPTRLSYLEMGIGVPASFARTQGQYAVYLYLDTATAIVPGREIYGWPKKDAEISFIVQDETVTAQVVRGGSLLTDARVDRTRRINPIPGQAPAPWFNLKRIPSVRADAPPDILQLTSVLIHTDTKLLDTGSAALTLGSSETDPLGAIPILEILDGRYTEDNITLGYGDVVHDYLVENTN